MNKEQLFLSQEEKEAEDKNIKIVVGHHFEEKQSRSSKHYCEKCNSVIWGMLQRWYRCTGKEMYSIHNHII